jgi:hypothetical protein
MRICFVDLRFDAPLLDDGEVQVGIKINITLLTACSLELIEVSFDRR